MEIKNEIREFVAMPREIDVHALDTVERIEALIRSKIGGGDAAGHAAIQ